MTKLDIHLLEREAPINKELRYQIIDQLRAGHSVVNKKFYNLRANNPDYHVSSIIDMMVEEALLHISLTGVSKEKHDAIDSIFKVHTSSGPETNADGAPDDTTPSGDPSGS
jgi:hypothetical protein